MLQVCRPSGQRRRFNAASLALEPNKTKQHKTQSILSALVNQVPAKADLKAGLSMYKYLDNVWQFVMSDVVLRLSATGSGSLKKAPEVRCALRRP